MGQLPNLDAKKLALLNEFQNMSKGKSSNEILPLVLAISQKSKSMGLKFSKDEMKLIIDSLKSDMPQSEKKQFDSMLNMMPFFK